VCVCETVCVFVCVCGSRGKGSKSYSSCTFNSLLRLQTLLDDSCTHTHTRRSTSVTVGVPVKSGERGREWGGAERLLPRTPRRSTSLISMTTEMLRQQIRSELKKRSQGKLMKEHRLQTRGGF